MLNKWFWFILGILTGWLVGWLVELLYWRQKRRQLYEERIKELKGSLEACRRQVAELRDEVERRGRTVVELEQELAAPAEVPIPDDLSEIRGIGEVYKKKLYEAGIVTFADLAASTEEELRAVIQPEGWQAVDFAGWIAQAREMTRRKKP